MNLAEQKDSKYISNNYRNSQTGATLIVDEFDASLHPMALMSIVGAFHNDEINKKGAQLIFNTHNPIFLNKNILEEMRSSLLIEMIIPVLVTIILCQISEHPDLMR